MAWRRLGDKPLSEPMMIISLTHIYVTLPLWVDNASDVWQAEMLPDVDSAWVED